MKKKKTIFEILLENNICHAVIISVFTFKNIAIGIFSKDYCIIIHNKDLIKVKNFKFYQTKEFDDILQYDMSDAEIAEFKKNMAKYVKVQHDNNGRGYELKNNSFKKYMKKQKNEREMERNRDNDNIPKKQVDSSKKQANNCIFSKQFFINGAGLRQF